MNEVQLIKTRYNDKKEIIVSGRELYEFLGIAERYSKWFDRMVSYGFDEGIDYTPYRLVHPLNGQEITDHALVLDMAKEISMLQRNEKGKEARKYFLEIERRWNSPEMVMKRALEFANERVVALENKLEVQKPKVLLAESIENSDDLILIGDLAKILKQNGVEIGQNRLFEKLRNLGYLTKRGKNKNAPTQRSMDLGLFRIVEGTRTGSDGIKLTKTTKVTGKGQMYFVNKFKCAD